MSYTVSPGTCSASHYASTASALICDLKLVQQGMPTAMEVPRGAYRSIYGLLDAALDHPSLGKGISLKHGTMAILCNHSIALSAATSTSPKFSNEDSLSRFLEQARHFLEKVESRRPLAGEDWKTGELVLRFLGEIVQAGELESEARRMREDDE